MAPNDVMPKVKLMKSGACITAILSLATTLVSTLAADIVMKHCVISDPRGIGLVFDDQWKNHGEP